MSSERPDLIISDNCFRVFLECPFRHHRGLNFWSVRSVPMSSQLISVHPSHSAVDTASARNVLQPFSNVLMIRWVSIFRLRVISIIMMMTELSWFSSQAYMFRIALSLSAHFTIPKNPSIFTHHSRAKEKVGKNIIVSFTNTSTRRNHLFPRSSSIAPIH